MKKELNINLKVKRNSEGICDEIIKEMDMLGYVNHKFIRLFGIVYASAEYKGKKFRFLHRYNENTKYIIKAILQLHKVWNSNELSYDEKINIRDNIQNCRFIDTLYEMFIGEVPEKISVQDMANKLVSNVLYTEVTKIVK